MVDLHYDLLTDIYIKSLSHDIDKVKSFCKRTYRKDNITGGILNLYYMSKAEMLDEFNIKEEDIKVIPWFEKVIKTIELNNLITSNNFILGLEGCDYLESIEDLDILYKLGLRSIQPVWNEKNKFGSGIRYEGGLTTLGAELIERAINLGIGIDLSHANEQTFFDIINFIKVLSSKPNVYVSHANVREICNHPRNLTDRQIMTIKEVNGVIGLMPHRNFVKKNNVNLSCSEIEDYYIQHISHIKRLLGDVKNIAVATDDMNFHPDDKYHNLNIYDLSTIASQLKLSLLKNKYTVEEANDIMYNNGSKIIKRIKNNGG